MNQVAKHSLTKTCVHASMLMNNNHFIYTVFRPFARKNIKYPKGSFGSPNNLAMNSGFPKHKELFTESYYSGEPQSQDVDK